MKAIANDTCEIPNPRMAEKGFFTKPKGIDNWIKRPSVFPKAIVGDSIVFLLFLFLLCFDLEGKATGFLTEVHGRWMSAFGNHPSFVFPTVNIWLGDEPVWVEFIYAGFRK